MRLPVSGVIRFGIVVVDGAPVYLNIRNSLHSVTYITMYVLVTITKQNPITADEWVRGGQKGNPT